MEVTAEKNFQLNADINVIWKALTNPEIIVVCIPGSQLTETIDEDHFKGEISVKIGPVIAKFRGEVLFSKRDSSTYELVMMGKGADINGKGGAAMNMGLTLNELETCTEAYCKMTVSITGRIAQFGSRMFEAVNNKLLSSSSIIFPICPSKKIGRKKQLSFMLSQNWSKQHHLLVLLLSRNSKENLVIKRGRVEKILE